MIWRLILCLCAGSLISLGETYHSFTDKEGRSIQAKIIKFDSQSMRVTLERENRKVATVPLDIFSEADQEYIRSWSPSPVVEEDKKNQPEHSLTSQDIKNISKQYADAIKTQNHNAFSELFYDYEGDPLTDFFKRVTPVNGRVFEASIGRLFDNGFMTKIAVSQTIDRGRTVGGDQDYVYEEWVLLTHSGKIKYDSLIKPHPLQLIVDPLVQMSYKIDESGEYKLKARLFIKVLEENSIPTFGFDPESDADDSLDTIEEIIDWVLDNGSHFDSTEPKLYLPKMEFSRLKDSLKKVERRL